MLQGIGRITGWLLVGSIGTFAAISASDFYVGAQVPLKLRSGGEVQTGAWERGYVSANGTWIVEGENQATPLQYTELACYRSDNTCRSATAEVFMQETLSLKTDVLTIIRWTESTLIFADTSGLCVDYTYTISRANQRVVGTRTPKKNSDPSCTTGQNVLQLSLVDGAKVTLAQEREAKAKTQPYTWAGLAALWAFILSRLLQRRPPERWMEEAAA